MDSLNKNNFLRWTGKFNIAPFNAIARNDEVTIVKGQASVDILPLANDSATYGIAQNSLQITIQDNFENPAVWNSVTSKITYYLDPLTELGQRFIKYKWKDYNGNSSNEATVTINVVDRPTAWRVYPASFACVLDGGGNRTGYGAYSLLEKYYPDTQVNVTPLTTKSNVSTDPDYVAPVIDQQRCSTQAYTQWNLKFGASLQVSCVVSATMAVYTATNDGFGGLIPGAYVFSDNAFTTPLPNGFYGDNNGHSYLVSGGQIIDVLDCGGPN